MTSNLTNRHFGRITLEQHNVIEIPSWYQTSSVIFICQTGKPNFTYALHIYKNWYDLHANIFMIKILSEFQMEEMGIKMLGKQSMPGYFPMESFHAYS